VTFWKVVGFNSVTYLIAILQPLSGKHLRDEVRNHATFMRHLKRSEAGSVSLDALRGQLDTDYVRGLSTNEIEERLEKFGKNAIAASKTRSPMQILAAQFNEVIIWLLVAAGVAAIIIGDIPVGVAVFAVIIVNTLIGFFTEWRAVQTMQALRQLGTVETAVRRDEHVIKVPTDELVPGDVVILGSGDVVPADLRLIEANRLQVEEAALTGESEPVSKHTEPLDANVGLAEQKNMVFKGTAITSGSGEGVVVATGMKTELGHISELVDRADEETTPLEARLDALGRTLIWIIVAIAAVITVSGLLVGRDLILMVETGIALAIASVPEGIPITATVALALGMRRMAKRNALVKKLATVETLGSTNIICTDKTGTLTAGRMSVQYYQLADDRIQIDGDILSANGAYKREANGQIIDPKELDSLNATIKIGVLCNNAAVTHRENGSSPDIVGQPLEIALLVAGQKAGYTRSDLLEQYPEEREFAFDAERKMMATIHTHGGDEGAYLVAVKGAPEAVLEVCTHFRHNGGASDLSDEERKRWQQRNEESAAGGLRVLGLAYKIVDSVDVDPYSRLTFLGMSALLDPPRNGVKATIKACQDAGIRLVMVTGDQERTARKIAEVLGIAEQENVTVVLGSEIQDELSEEASRKIIESNILSRVSPEQKLILVNAHQNSGAIIAMTGDGVNDAPALKQADIGVAMGSGTEVAKEAADMVLQDDNLSTIVFAIEQGRTIFDNIRRFIIYLLSSNISTVIAVGVVTVLNAPLPVSPVQVLFLNVVVDVFPALALSVGKSHEDVMQRPPRHPDSAIIERAHWVRIVIYGTLIAGAVLGAFFLAWRVLGLEGDAMVTISFLTLMLAKLWHVFNMRDVLENPIVNSVTTNPWVWGALGVSMALILASIYFPPLASVLVTVPPTAQGWGIILGMSLIPFTVIQILKAVNLLE
jgi:Ca2+-transporting ATPase